MKKLIITLLPAFGLLLFIGACSTPQNSVRLSKPKTVDQGYGLQNESSRTTAISHQKISREDETLTMADLLSRTPGVSVMGSGRNLVVRIRARKSISETNDPLFVINGQIMGLGFQSVSFVDPFMIDNISILKDAAASSSTVIEEPMGSS